MANGQLPWLAHFSQQDAPGLSWRTVKRPFLFAPQPFSGDPKGFAKSQELDTTVSNSLRFLTLNPLSLFFRKGLNGAHKSLFTKRSFLDGIGKSLI